VAGIGFDPKDPSNPNRTLLLYAMRRQIVGYSAAWAKTSAPTLRIAQLVMVEKSLYN